MINRQAQQAAEAGSSARTATGEKEGDDRNKTHDFSAPAQPSEDMSAFLSVSICIRMYLCL